MALPPTASPAGQPEPDDMLGALVGLPLAFVARQQQRAACGEGRGGLRSAHVISSRGESRTMEGRCVFECQ